MPATIETTSFSPAELPVIQGALQSVLSQGALHSVTGTIARMIQVLRMIRATVGQGPSPVVRPLARRLQGINRDRDRLYGIFQVNASNIQARADINAIIGRYTAADSVLNNPSNRIARLTPAILRTINSRRTRARAPLLDAAYVWAHASAADLIHIGDAFFNPQQSDVIRRHVANCRGSVNLDLAMRAVLVHEAVHIHNGVGGHASLSHIENPDNYSLFIMYTACDNLRAQIRTSTDRRMARVEERTHSITGRGGFRRPGPLT